MSGEWSKRVAKFAEKGYCDTRSLDLQNRWYDHCRKRNIPFLSLERMGNHGWVSYDVWPCDVRTCDHLVVGAGKEILNLFLHYSVPGKLFHADLETGFCTIFLEDASLVLGFLKAILHDPRNWRTRDPWWAEEKRDNKWVDDALAEFKTRMTRRR